MKRDVFDEKRRDKNIINRAKLVLETIDNFSAYAPRSTLEKESNILGIYCCVKQGISGREKNIGRSYTRGIRLIKHEDNYNT